MIAIDNRMTTSPRARAPALLTVFMAMALGACASTPAPPLQALQAAELAITNAEQAGVADYANPQLNQARQKLESAHSAVQQEEMVLAARYAEESKVEADLASAHTEMLKARAVNAGMQESIDTLKQELLRNSGSRQ